MTADIGEMFDDEDAAEEFIELLDVHGLVVSSTEDGVVIGLTKDKIKELLDVAESNDDKKIIIFVKGKTEEESPIDVQLLPN